MSGRLLLATESYWPNLDGGALFQRRLAHAMSELGWSVAIWAPSVDGRRGVERDGPVTVMRTPSRVLRSNPRYRTSRVGGLRPRGVFDAIGPDVVHVHNPAWIGWSAMMIATVRSVPVVATNHLLPGNILAYSPLGRRIPGAETLIWRYLRTFHARADVVVSPSRTGADLLAAAGVRRRIEVISNGVATRTFVPGRRSPSEGELRLVYVGRVDPEKQIELLIDGVVNARRLTPVRLDILGPCRDQQRMERRISMLDARDYISLRGIVTEAEKQAALRGADAFCTASTAELECIAALEAMASGIPVIAPAAGALPELVRPHETGLLFTPDDASALARAIAEAARLPLVRMGRNARNLVCAERDERDTYTAYAAIFDRVRRGPACE